MAEGAVNYKAELDKLSSADREAYLTRWQNHLAKLPQPAYVATLTRLTKQFGPEFTSELVQPTQDVREPAPAPKATAPVIEPPEPAWWQKPIVWAAEQPALKPIFQGLETYQQKYITPAAMNVAQLASPQLRRELAGRQPFDIPEAERTKIWEEKVKLPWIAKTGAELLVDPLMYIGWGIPGALERGATKAGMKTVAKAIHPITSIEEAYIRAAALPIKGAAKVIKKTVPAIVPDIAELRATGRLVLRKPLEESARSIVNNLPTHTYDALHSLNKAGEITGKPFSQILEDFRMGIPDTELLKTVTNTNQQRAIKYLQQNANKLDLDTIIKIADKHPDTAASVIGWKQVGLVAKELGLPEVKLATGITGSVQKMANKLYSLWKRTVLQTPYYVLQNTVENPIREIMTGVSPIWDITDFAKLAAFSEHPMDIQRRVISLADRWNKTMPEHVSSPFARTPATGGITEAVAGAVAIGKSMPASTVAAYMDDTAIVNTYFNMYNRYVKALMEKTSPETAKALVEIKGLYSALRPPTTAAEVAEKYGLRYDGQIAGEAHQFSLLEAAPYNLPSGETKLGAITFSVDNISDVPKELAKQLKKFGITDRVIPPIIDIEPKLLEHLEQVAITGTADDVIKAFAEIQRNKTLTIARAMNSLEKGLPDVVRSKIKAELPRLWAKNDINGINRLFEELRRTMPSRIETYQKQVMVQRLRSYRDLLRTSVPRKYQPFVTKVLNSFKLSRVSEAEARIASSKSLSEFQQAMFKASQESRRELEALAEATMLTEAIARNVDNKVLEAWYFTSEQINRNAFKVGEELVDRTFAVSDVLRYAKDPAKIQSAWDNYIMGIQSEFPEIAESLRAITAPDADTLWSAYRSIQERRWFNVGQEKLRAMGVDFNQFPRVIGADGKLLTQEDFLQSQLKALKGWEDRVISAWDKRHITPTTKNQLLDTLREQTIAAKESIALQERTIQNQARDLALGTTYSTFGNYATRTNLDEFMTGIGAPFWFFPSRSIPFYMTQMMQKPRLGVELVNMQKEVNESDQPARLFGTIQIPGTNYWYNPIQSTMLWQLADQRNFVPAGMGGLEQGDNWLRNNLAISLGPQWKIATALVERMMGRQLGETPLTAEPSALIPQQRWLDAVAGLRLPVISPAVGLLNEPFDMYLRGVYGDSVAEWSKREVEKTIVDMGYNPQTASKEVIQKAWEKYYIRQLLSIPGGAVKEMTPTEMARFEAINQKASELGLTKQQRVTLRELGESPFTGMRQDQLEAMYEDIPASKLWRYIRPYGLTAKSRPIWEDYIQLKLGRETLLYGSDINNPTKGSRIYNEQQFDKALRSSRISPREWKSLYRQNYAEYISKVEQLEADYKLAPKTDQDWEAYREMLGWDEPVRHPDDIKLDEYYETMDSSNFENDIGEFDYDAYKKAEQQFFAGLPQETIDYIKARKDRYKTPLRAAYSRDMEKVQPYYSLQDAILSQYPPQIALLIEYASTVPDPAIQKALMAGNPQALIAMRRVRLAKSQFRLKYPDIDRILRYWSS
jgi:hypothetical protein